MRGSSIDNRKPRLQNLDLNSGYITESLDQIHLLYGLSTPNSEAPTLSQQSQPREKIETSNGYARSQHKPPCSDALYLYRPPDVSFPRQLHCLTQVSPPLAHNFSTKPYSRLMQSLSYQQAALQHTSYIKTHNRLSTKSNPNLPSFHPLLHTP